MRMKVMKTIMLTLLWTCICQVAQGNVMAQSRSSIDVAIVMDSSGSMKKTDPGSLRIPAAKLFISLLGSSDRAAVLSFSDQGYPIAGLTPVNNEANKQKLLNATDKITSKGLYTNLYGAFNKGMEILLDSKEEGREQIIVLMSDGMMDVGDPDRDRQLLDKLRSELSGVLTANNIKVYAIAFTDQSDRTQLEKLSKQTGGFYNLALTDRDFHLIFTSIFESLKSPEMLPMESNGFLIDGSIQEVTIVVSKESAATAIQINAPDGQQYAGNQKYSGISWFVSDNFDMITVQKPVEGRWKILYSTGENNKAYIITDLTLETNFEQLYAVFGENLDIKAWLEKEGSIIRGGEVLEATDIYIELSNPDGNISHLNPLNDGEGIFHKRITPFKDGNYTLKVIAKGKTYEREKAFLFNVANLQESKEDLKAAREAKKALQEDVTEQGDGEEQEPINWGEIIIKFISLNLVIGLLIIAYMKRQGIKDLKLIGKLFKRSKDNRTLKTNTKETEERNAEAESETEEPAEKEPEQIAQASKLEVALEDAESEEKEDEQESEEEDQEPVKERVALEEAASEEDSPVKKGNDAALKNIEEEIQRLEKLKQQDRETQPAEAIEEIASETEAQMVSDKADEKQTVESKEEKTDNLNNEQETDDQALQAKTKESPAPLSEAEVTAEIDEAETAQEQDKEDDIDDMWADALNEQAASESKEEKTDSLNDKQETDDQALQAKTKESPAPLSEAEVTAEIDEAETAQEQDKEDDIDDMWADALNEQAAVERIEEETESTDEAQQTEAHPPQAVTKESPEAKTEEITMVNTTVNADTDQSAIEEVEPGSEIHEPDVETQPHEDNKTDETREEEHAVRGSIAEETKPGLDESEVGKIDDMWEAAMDEQEKVEESFEKTAINAVDTSPENSGFDEVENKKDADQMWAEALSDHEEAKEDSSLDNKDNPGGSQGAAS